MQSSGAVLGYTCLYAPSAAGQGAAGPGQGAICGYADIWAGISHTIAYRSRLQMGGTSSSVSLWGVCVGVCVGEWAGEWG